jgi:hypothetical protein
LVSTMGPYLLHSSSMSSLISEILLAQRLKNATIRIVCTFVFLVVDQLVRGNHVHEAHYAAVLEVVGGRAGEHGNGTNATVKAGSLLHTNCCARDLEVAVAKGNVVQAFNDGVDDVSVCILAESNALR